MLLKAPNFKICLFYLKSGVPICPGQNLNLVLSINVELLHFLYILFYYLCGFTVEVVLDFGVVWIFLSASGFFLGCPGR